MARQTLIAPSELQSHITDPNWVVVDCRFALKDTESGSRAYFEAHVPGAVYAHLDRDLSSPVIPGKTGRHPLPDPDKLAERFSAWGIGPDTQVVAYDDSNGSMAARLWWLARWLGHSAVAVLDGGWQAWLEAGYATRGGTERRAARQFVPRLRPELAMDAAAVDQVRTNPAWRVLDARARDRFRGENETIDPVGGHIPGAHSTPYAENLQPNGRFRPVDELKSRFTAELGGQPIDRVVCYCGSGVSAAHNLLAIAHAGLGDARLYPGSWSEWIADPARPIARGE